MNKLKIMKAVVFFLTFLIVFGLLSAALLIYEKLSAPKSFASEFSLNQPAGSFIESFHTNNNLLYVLIKGGNEPDRILVVNPKTGAVITSVKTR